MPRYFFHVYDGQAILDAEGTERDNDEAARKEAIAASSEIIADLGEKFWTGNLWQMEVVDEAGRSVHTLHFRGCVTSP